MNGNYCPKRQTILRRDTGKFLRQYCLIRAAAIVEVASSECLFVSLYVKDFVRLFQGIYGVAFGQELVTQVARKAGGGDGAGDSGII